MDCGIFISIKFFLFIGLSWTLDIHHGISSSSTITQCIGIDIIVYIIIIPNLLVLEREE